MSVTGMDVFDSTIHRTNAWLKEIMDELGWDDRCFEQSYGDIEGDSASSAELYALLSGLSGIPLRQDIAVTGSVNQRGRCRP